MNDSLLTEQFVEYIRNQNDFDVPYYSFAIKLNKGKPIPNMISLALDGTYSYFIEQIDAVVCFCFNNKTLVCYVENNYRIDISKSNPPDKEHENNWNRKDETTFQKLFTKICFDFNPLVSTGVYEKHNEFFDLILDVREEIVYIDYQARHMLNGYQIVSHHLDGCFKKIG